MTMGWCLIKRLTSRHAPAVAVYIIHTRLSEALNASRKESCCPADRSDILASAVTSSRMRSSTPCGIHKVALPEMCDCSWFCNKTWPMTSPIPELIVRMKTNAPLARDTSSGVVAACNAKRGD
jgi:hypothetical protein